MTHPENCKPAPAPEGTGTLPPGRWPQTVSARAREYTPEQAAAALGISVDELRLRIRLYVIGSDPRVKSPMPDRFRASDLLVLHHLAGFPTASMPPR